MKKNLLYLLALICTMSLFTACSDDDNEPWKEIPQGEISADSGNATLLINGESSTTGSVKMSVKNELEATLEMKNVIPGYSDLNVDVELQKQSDNSYRFSGTAQINTAPTTRLAASAPALLTVEVNGTITLDGKVNLNVTATGAGLFVGTYSNVQLALKYSEADLAGKTVYYTIPENIPVLTLVNVIPGEQTTTIPGVYLGEDGSFSGEITSATGATVTYSGAITAASGMTLKVGATLSADAQGGLTATWPLSHELLNEEWQLAAHPSVLVVWDETAEKFDGDYFSFMVASFASAPLAEVLNDITLTADGNLVAKYYSDIIPKYFDPESEMWKECEPTDNFMGMGFPVPAVGNWIVTMAMGYPIKPYDREWKTSPKNLVHWYVKGDYICIIPNVAQIVKQLAADQAIDESMMNTINTVMGLLPALAEMDDVTLQTMAKDALAGLLPNVDLSALDAKLIRQVLNWLVDGIPLKYKAENGSLYLYVDKTMVEPFMKLLIPLLPTLEAELVKIMSEEVSLSPILSMFFGVNSLTELGDIWNNNTTAFELGLNFLTTNK